MADKTKKRSGTVAGLLTFVHPGIGLLYIGRPWLALAAPLLPFVLLFLARVTGIALNPLGLFGCGIAIGAGWLAAIAWCAYQARNQGEVALKRYQRWYVYLAYHLIFGILFLSVPLDPVLDFLGARVYRIPSVSMSDSLLPGDYIVVDTWAYRGEHVPRRGEVVVVFFPAYPNAAYARRVIGLPGEHLQITNGMVYVNGVQLRESYIDPRNNQSPYQDGVYDVPAGGYLLLGDNRDKSEDGRYLGSVSLSEIHGRVRAIGLSYRPPVGLSFQRTASIPEVEYVDGAQSVTVVVPQEN